MAELVGEKYYTRGTVDRFEGTQAVLMLDDGQELVWPIKNLPDDAKEGTSVRVVLSTSATDEEERKKTAKTMLNEIFQGSE
jgi:hypothetical protein